MLAFYPGSKAARQNKSATYYAAVATIETQLQSGTTPGNPRLVQKLQTARQALDQLGGDIQMLNDVSLQLNSLSTHAGYLMETVKATYSLSGAVEEDHVRLQKIEDGANATNALIDRMLTNVNDDITRTNAYMAGERNNLRTLSAGVESGSMLGRSLANRPLSASDNADASSTAQDIAGNTSTSGGPSGSRPLMKIRFDRPDINYQQPLYIAVSDALKRYPNARFSLVAIHPSRGNAAQVAIESTKARRDGENVLRSLTQMGLTNDRVDVSYAPSAEASSSEVQLYIR